MSFMILSGKILAEGTGRPQEERGEGLEAMDQLPPWDFPEAPPKIALLREPHRDDIF